MFINPHDQLLLFVLGQAAAFAAMNAETSIARVQEYLDKLLVKCGMPKTNSLALYFDPACQSVTLTAEIGEARLSSTGKLFC